MSTKRNPIRMYFGNDLFAPVLRRIVFPLWAAWERSPYLRIAKSLRQRERTSAAEREREQWGRLVRIVDHAWRESPFCREHWSQHGFEPGMLKDPGSISRIPLLAKAHIVEADARILARDVPRSTLRPRKTSGSTGVSLRFFVDPRCEDWRRAIALYRDRWAGWRPGEWRAMIWGNPEYPRSYRGRLRAAFLKRTFYLDTLRMDEPMMERFARTIFRRRPTLLFGHAHSLYLFSRFWKERSLPSYNFRGIISTAMVLSERERAGISEVFGRCVFDRYGCEEVGLIASECEAHRGLHVNTDSLIVEVLKHDGSPAGPGEEGDVVVTDLWNYGMPFIRYLVGDRAVVSAEACPCGRTYPLLKRVAGRIADYLVTPEGEYISGISLTENFTTLIPGLYQAQIVQEERDHVLIRVVPKADFGDESRREIARLVAERFGPRMRHDVELVEKIPQEPSGKYRFAICQVPSRFGTMGADK